jgi:hypothetical protein
MCEVPSILSTVSTGWTLAACLKFYPNDTCFARKPFKAQCFRGCHVVEDHFKTKSGKAFAFPKGN